jgi:hypothetical protein
MKTDHLIRAIAGDVAAPRPDLGVRVVLALATGGAIAAAWFAGELGMRPDILAALQSWRFLLKLAVVLLALGCALWASMRLAQPGATLREVAPALAAAPLLLAAGSLLELAAVSPAEWSARALGRYWLTCLVSIPLLSVAPLIALLFALRAGAPRSPPAAGTVAGGLAAALAATLYATHCPDDSPLFVALWYVPAMLPAVLAGALVGHRVLRW